MDGFQASQGAASSRRRRLLLFWFFLLAALPARADIYAWRDGDGTPVFSDQPPYPGAAVFIREAVRGDTGPGRAGAVMMEEPQSLPDSAVALPLQAVRPAMPGRRARRGQGHAPTGEHD